MKHFEGYAKQQDLGKKLALISDCKTCDSSMFNMVSRLLHMKNVMFKAMLELATKLSDLSEALEVHDCVSNAVPRRDCTLSTANQVFEYILKTLKAQASSLYVLLYEAT